MKDHGHIGQKAEEHEIEGKPENRFDRGGSILAPGKAEPFPPRVFVAAHRYTFPICRRLSRLEFVPRVLDMSEIWQKWGTRPINANKARILLRLAHLLILRSSSHPMH